MFAETDKNETIESKAHRRGFIVLACLGGIAWCLFSLVYYADRASSFAEFGQRAQGTVGTSSSKPCVFMDRCGLRYSFTTREEIEFMDLKGNRHVVVRKSKAHHKRLPRIGNTYTVWYLSNDPTTYYLGSKGVSDRAWFLFKPLLILGVFLFAGAAGWFYFAYNDEDFPAQGEDSGFWID